MSSWSARNNALLSNQDRPALDLDFVQGVLDPRITFTRSGLYGTATYFDSAGVLRNAAVNQMTLSTDFAVWTNTGGATTLTNNAALAPNGTLTAARSDTGDTISGIHSNFKAFTSGAVSTPYVGSIYVKADQYPRVSFYFGNTAFANINTGGLFDLTAGTVAATAAGSTCTIAHVGDGWYRLTCTATSDADGGNFLLLFAFAPASLATVAGNFTPASMGLGGWLFGAQVEVGTVASPYIPTGAAINGAPRFDFDLGTARTNAVRNSSASVGTAPGTPGTLPTNWAYTGPPGVAITVGTPTTVDGISVVPLTFAGTAGSTTSVNINCEALATAAVGETWSASVWMALASGAPLRNSRLELDELTSGGGFLGGTQTNITPTTTLQRFSQTRAFVNPTTGRARFLCAQFEMQAGDVVNFTIYIGQPQLEIGPAASHYISTSGAAASGNALAKGLLVEETRTNSIRNTTNVGAVVGTPGTPPTNWSPAATGLTIQLVAFGTLANGLPYIDYRFSGTTGATFGQIILDGTTNIPALNAQVWTQSLYVALVGGSTANITAMTSSLSQRDAGGLVLTTLGAITNYVGSLSATMIRVSGSATLNNASTAFVMPLLGFSWTSGVAVDFTLRIAGVQLELGAFASSYIPTSTVAVARGAEHAVIQGALWLRQDVGTLLSEVTLEGLAGNAFLATINDGANQNEIRHFASVGNFIAGGILASNVTKYSQTSGATFTVGPTHKFGVAYTESNARSVLNGAPLTGGTAMTPPLPVVDRMQIMSRTPAVFTTNGWLRRLRYWPRMLSVNELQGVTL